MHTTCICLAVDRAETSHIKITLWKILIRHYSQMLYPFVLVILVDAIEYQMSGGKAPRHTDMLTVIALGINTKLCRMWQCVHSD